MILCLILTAWAFISFTGGVSNGAGSSLVHAQWLLMRKTRAERSRCTCRELYFEPGVQVEENLIATLRFFFFLPEHPSPTERACQLQRRAKEPAKFHHVNSSRCNEVKCLFLSWSTTPGCHGAHRLACSYIRNQSWCWRSCPAGLG